MIKYNIFESPEGHIFTVVHLERFDGPWKHGDATKAYYKQGKLIKTE